MNTPITKRIHMNAAKKNSIAKQSKPKTEKGYYNKDGKKYQYDASSTLPTTNAAGASLTAPEAISGGKAGVPWENKMKELFKSGVSIDELVKKGHGTKEGLSNLFKGLEQNTGTTQGEVEIKDKLVMKDPTKGTTVDTSTAYNIRQISRGQKKAARDVRRAKIKLSKLGIQDTEGKWVAKTGISARDKAKFEERLAELGGMENTQKRIMDMAKAGVDPRRTARFEIGTEMKAGDPGGKPVKDTSGKYQTKEEFENKAKKEAGINLGTVDSKAGNMVQGDALNKILKKNIDEKSKVTRPVSTVMSNAASRGYSTSSALVKKYNNPTSMLKKSCMKMGGFGSKTYKK